MVYIYGLSSHVEQSYTFIQSLQVYSDPSYSWVGSSVSLSNDASTLVVGRANDNAGRGSMYVFRRHGFYFNMVKQLLVDTYGITSQPEFDGNKQFGESVAISGDGRTGE